MTAKLRQRSARCGDPKIPAIQPNIKALFRRQIDEFRTFGTVTFPGCQPCDLLSYTVGANKDFMEQYIGENAVDELMDLFASWNLGPKSAKKKIP